MSINVCNDRSMASITSLPSGVSGSSLVLISTVTASSSSTVTFDSGIDSTYKEYQVHYIDVHPSAGDNHFTVNFRDGSTAYDATKTSTMFRAYHREDDGGNALSYVTGGDLAQSTGSQQLGQSVDADNDSSLSGILHLFDPSSTTFVKHFIARSQEVTYQTTSQEFYVAGYCNVTAAIDGLQFSMSSGNIDSGTFKLYGVV